MGKTLFAAVFAAILASIATTLLMSSLDSEAKKARQEEEARLTKELRSQNERVDIALSRVDRMEQRLARAAAAPSVQPVAEIGGEEGAAAPAGPLAPDGTPYVSRAELEKIIEERAAQGGFLGGDPIDIPEPKKLEEIAREMNLGASEEAALRNMLREQEEEFVKMLFGDRPLSDIRQDLLNARDDEELLNSLIQGAVTRGFQNIGSLMTMEKRKRRRVKEILGDERGDDFLGRPMEPIIGGEFEGIFEELFD